MLAALVTTVIVFLAASRKACGQDVIFSQFYANPLYLNPAFAGSKQCDRLIFNYRNHPFPDFGTYSTYSFSADTYLPAISGGVGMNLIHDSQAGLLSHTQAGLMYAWQGRLSREWNLSLGLQASYMNYRVNAADFVFPDQYNPSGTGNFISGESPLELESSHNIDFATGFLVYSSTFYTGFAVHHVNTPTLDIFEDEKLNIKYTFMIGYDYVPGRFAASQSDRFSLSPNMIIQSQSGRLRFNYGLYTHLEMVSAGVWFRHSFDHANSLIFMLGLKQVNYTISYSYDYSLSGFYSPQNGVHEIGVLLNFNCPAPTGRYRILNCPTF